MKKEKQSKAGGSIGQMIMQKYARSTYGFSQFKPVSNFEHQVAFYAKKLCAGDKAFDWDSKTPAPVIFCLNDQLKNYDGKKWSLVKQTNSYSFLARRPGANLTPEETFLSKVIYAETSSVATDEEVKMICRVIMNRVKNRDFGNPQNPFEAVKVKNQFSCIGDKNNSNWNDNYYPEMNKFSQRDAKLAHQMMTGTTTSLPASDAVYYHDKSMKETPAGWTNKYWKPELVKTTEHFKFYKIVPNT